MPFYLLVHQNVQHCIVVERFMPTIDNIAFSHQIDVEQAVFCLRQGLKYDANEDRKQHYEIQRIKNRT